MTFSDDDALKIEILNKNIIIAGMVDDLYNKRDDERDWEIHIKDIHDDYKTYEVENDVEMYDKYGD